MTKIKTWKISIGIIILMAILLPFIYAENTCCEKTNTGLWCQNTDSSNCDASFKQAPTSCDTTSFCKRGCCYDSEEGLCMESTPKQVCQDSGGLWQEDSNCNIPQCSLGCCIIVDQGALVTLTRCKQISGLYGVGIDFRKDITDEIECIATAQAKDKGACVFEVDYSRTCRFLTREECTGEEVSGLDANGSVTNTSVSFYEGILCSAEELATDCAKTRYTMLIEGKDEVYFKDSCGNPANIYDASKINDDNYWKYLYRKDESCGYGSSNGNSKTCGNCDYFLGSIGKKAENNNKAAYGDYICSDLNCDNGKKHGESWCVYDPDYGQGKDRVGSRYVKNVCLNGEIIVEPCADYRNEICLESSLSGFTEAACRINRWYDCTSQVEEDDCTNLDLRECMWIKGYYFSDSTGIQLSTNDSNGDGKDDDKSPSGLCVPNYPPGLQFWGNSGAQDTESSKPFGAKTSIFGTSSSEEVSTNIDSADSRCSLANTKFEVKFRQEAKMTLSGKEWGNWECVQGEAGYTVCKTYYENGELKAIPTDWIRDMNKICVAMGDCGGYINYAGKGTEEGYAVYSDNERVAGSGGAETLEVKTPVTGKIIQDIMKRISEK